MDGIPIFTCCHNPEVIPFLEKVGFEVMEAFEKPAFGPPYFACIRRPRAMLPIYKPLHANDQLKEVSRISRKSLVEADILQDFPNVMEQIEIQEQLGQGKHGKVFRGVFNGEAVALKKILLAESFMEEERILRNLKHENIVKYLGVFFGADCFYIVFDFLTQGPLKQMILKQREYLEFIDLLGM